VSSRDDGIKNQPAKHLLIANCTSCRNAYISFDVSTLGNQWLLYAFTHTFFRFCGSRVDLAALLHIPLWASFSLMKGSFALVHARILCI